MGVSIGVDIGDVNARSALARPGEAGLAFPIGQERDRVTPAVVALNRDGRLLVGRPAVLVGRADPVNAASAVGRLLGRRYLDPDVETLRQQVSYRIVEGPRYGLYPIRGYSALPG
jgi:molecular chaperone DnaK